ncbi:hypothetical protein [Microbulbifer elongatus]|uniref:hypothetical protein n=1 Tax=Microbulbifer elongatus TaxID=86173 RepID=UPI001CFE0E6C|nr:hypothetical protein [Microbulbifer elongatus]
MNQADQSLTRNTIRHNSHELYALSLEEFDRTFKVMAESDKYASQRSTWEALKRGVEVGANYTATGKDVGTLTKLFADLGFSGTKAYIKYYKGRPYVIFKGSPALRKIFTGTRYGLQNAKVVQMGIGRSGAVTAARSGGILTIILVSAFRIADYILTDQMTLNQLVGTLATDVVKIGIATGASIVAAVGAAAVFTVAIGPTIAAIGVGLLVSYGLSKLDDHYEITTKLIAALDELEQRKNVGLEKLQKNTVDFSGELVGGAIDYAVDEARRILINTARHYLPKRIPQW